jgi:hypothetical protein
MLKRIGAQKRIFFSLQHAFVLSQIEYLYANFCEYFEANKANEQINCVCQYTETCEYEANKIVFSLVRVEAKKKKVENTAYPKSSPENNYELPPMTLKILFKKPSVKNTFGRFLYYHFYR